MCKKSTPRSERPPSDPKVRELFPEPVSRLSVPGRYTPSPLLVPSVDSPCPVFPHRRVALKGEGRNHTTAKRIFSGLQWTRSTLCWVGSGVVVRLKGKPPWINFPNPWNKKPRTPFDARGYVHEAAGSIRPFGTVGEDHAPGCNIRPREYFRCRSWWHHFHVGRITASGTDGCGLRIPSTPTLTTWLGGVNRDTRHREYNVAMPSRTSCGRNPKAVNEQPRQNSRGSGYPRPTHRDDKANYQRTPQR